MPDLHDRSGDSTVQTAWAIHMTAWAIDHRLCVRSDPHPRDETSPRMSGTVKTTDRPGVGDETCAAEVASSAMHVAECVVTAAATRSVTD